MAIEYKLIKEFEITEEKAKLLVSYLINEPLYLSDEYRNREKAEAIVAYHLSDAPAMFFELGSFQGLLGFTELVPSYKAEVFFKLWDKELWGPSFARELKSFVNGFMERMGLKRLGLNTPDLVGANLAKKLCGFKVEGRQKYGFMFGGKMMTNIMLRKIKREV